MQRCNTMNHFFTAMQKGTTSSNMMLLYNAAKYIFWWPSSVQVEPSCRAKCHITPAWTLQIKQTGGLVLCIPNHFRTLLYFYKKMFINNKWNEKVCYSCTTSRRCGVVWCGVMWRTWQAAAHVYGGPEIDSPAEHCTALPRRRLMLISKRPPFSCLYTSSSRCCCALPLAPRSTE